MKSKHRNEKIIIGIDTGTNTGIGIVINRILTDVLTTDFWGAISIINENSKGIELSDLLVIVEKANTLHNWQPNKQKGAAAYGQKISFNIAKPYYHAELILEYCIKNGINAYSVPPLGKVNQDDFSKLTGYTKRTSNHARDAAMIACSAAGIC